jgi:carbon storage regulator CsrA
MLVIARRVQECLVLPSVQASIHVVAVRSNAVRLGVEAPPEVTVLRGELYERLGGSEAPAGAAGPPESGAARREHALRNHLNNISLALGMLRRQLGPSSTTGARELLDRAGDECVALRQLLETRPRAEVLAVTVTPPPASVNGAGS